MSGYEGLEHRFEEGSDGVLRLVAVGPCTCHDCVRRRAELAARDAEAGGHVVCDPTVAL